MLIGSYWGILSESRRFAVPKKFLDELGDSPIIAKWYENCLILVDNNFWTKLSKRLTAERNTFDIGVRDIERFILGSAFEIEADDQGRVIVPEALAKYAGLTKEVVFVGLMDRVEIWDKNVWEVKSKGLEKITKEYIEKISNNVKTKH